MVNGENMVLKIDNLIFIWNALLLVVKSMNGDLSTLRFIVTICKTWMIIKEEVEKEEEGEEEGKKSCEFNLWYIVDDY